MKFPYLRKANGLAAPGAIAGVNEQLVPLWRSALLDTLVQEAIRAGRLDRQSPHDMVNNVTTVVACLEETHRRIAEEL